MKTERLGLRKMSADDFDDVAQMLLNPEVMYAWEHEFSLRDVEEWIKKNMLYYEDFGYAYFLAEDILSGDVVGQIALLQDFVNGKNYHEVGYIIKKEYWGKGYACEGANALVQYAFETLNVPEVIAEIRPMNIWSINVAQRLGMVLKDEFSKNVRGKMMLHLVYLLENPLDKKAP